MRLYRRFIRPVHCYPGQGYEPKTEPVEKEEKWYPEEERKRLEEKYGYLNEGHFSDLIFEEKYEPCLLKDQEPIKEVNRLTPETICSGLRIIQAEYEKEDVDFNIMFVEGTDVSLCRILSEAIELLKKQEPIKPTINEDGKAYCVCGENVGIIPSSKNLPKICLKYCPECGRRMIFE